jgi:hypothetical protein
MIWADRQGGEQQPERLDRPEHQMHGGVRKHAELVAVLTDVGEEAHEDL